MPILERAEDDAPLEQGDLLVDLILHYTDAENVPRQVKGARALVISRPCRIQNEDRFCVACVVPCPTQLPKDLQGECEDVVALADRLSTVRDADGSDVFYLGSIPGDDTEQRLAAQLNFLSTIEVPAAQRIDWVKTHRVARLDLEFRRDLHTRFFLSIAKQGFDDERWFSDSDLKLLVDFGKAKLARATSSVKDAEADIQAAKFSNDFERKKQGLHKKLELARASEKKASEALAPFLKEDARRKSLPESDSNPSD